MPHRNDVLSKLQKYRQHTLDPDQNAKAREIESFVKSNLNCFDRNLLIGHVTGSAVLLSRDRSQVCLTLHRKFNKWVQLGGHADGNPDILAVALNEAQEESGILEIAPLSQEIFDVCIHDIPEYQGIPAHKHYDIRFLLGVESEAPLVISHESIDLAWFKHNDPILETCNPSVQRLINKWQSMPAANITEILE